MPISDDEKRRHEYDLMDRRLGEQRVIDEIKEHLEARVKPLEDRTTSLETSRTFVRGVIKTVGVGAPAVGSIAWFCWELGKMFGHKIK